MEILHSEVIGKKISTSAMGVRVGLEIRGVNLAEPLAPESIDAIQNCLLERQFINFPDQDLTPQRILEIVKHFGQPEVNPLWAGMPGIPEVFRSAKKGGEPDPLVSGPRTVGSFLARPSKFVFAYCQDPVTNSDIVCASMTEAWNALSEPMKVFLSNLTAVHSGASVYLPTSENAPLFCGQSSSLLKYTDAVNQCSEHPMVHTHADTGQRSLFVNPTFTQHITGIARNESRAILEFLWQHCAKPQMSCRIIAQAKSFMIWDNRVTTIMLGEYDKMQDRLMFFASTANEEPLTASSDWPVPPELVS